MILMNIGIYALRGDVPESTQYGYLCIGKTTVLDERGDQHFWSLRRGDHKNPKLQRYWNKYGEGSLQYEVLFYCEESKLDFWEIFLIDKMDTIKYGFNCREGGEGGVNLNACRKVILTNSETRETVEYKCIADFCRNHDLQDRSVAKLLDGKITHIRDWYNPLHDWRPKYYKVIDPEGKEWEFAYVNGFIHKHDLSFKQFKKLLNNKARTCNGWRMAGTPREDYRCKEFTLIDPEGNSHTAIGVRKFARDRKLDIHSIQKLVGKGIDIYKGWRRPDSPNPSTARYKMYRFVSPEGVLHSGRNITQFCRTTGLGRISMQLLHRGNLQSYKGWTLYKEKGPENPAL